MTEEIETMLYTQVARDLLERFGPKAYDVAAEAQASLLELGDETGGAIWSEITYAMGQIETGLVSTALH